MKNVRIDSLPSNRAVASYDCPSCIKRRIKCDRSIPSCKKCTSRDLECPGFQPLYPKWRNHGIDDRGRFKGKIRSILDTPKNSDCRPSTPDLQSANPRNQSHAGFYQSPAALDRERDCANRQISTLVFESLLSHFYVQVVPRFRWVDLPENPWRETIQPIAKSSICLRLAMGSHATAHLSITSMRSSDERSRFHSIHRYLRDACLRILNQRMHCDVLSAPVASNNLPGSFYIETLASMLLLCYAAAFIPGSLDWKVHLRACQAVISSKVLQGPSPGVDKGPEPFLLKEVADIEILSGLSTFAHDSSPITDSFFQHLHSESSWTFTGLVKGVTAMERQRYTAVQSHQLVPEIHMQLWHQRVEDAYARMLMAVGKLPEQQPVRQCLEAVILCHYYATLIYSYQAFAAPEELNRALELFLAPLQDQAESVIRGAVQQFSHDLFIPLFIIGTECRGDKSKEAAVEELFLKLLFTSEMWWNHTALQFLRAFWSSVGAQGKSWLQFARENEAEVGNFILF